MAGQDTQEKTIKYASGNDLPGTEAEHSLQGVFAYATKGIEIEPKPASFLWYPYFPIGQITLLGAPSGAGKSTTCTAVLAKLSKGEIPLSDESIDPVKILHITDEDEKGMIMERFISCGGNVNNIMVIDQDDLAKSSWDFSSEAGLDQLSSAIKALGIKLLVLDPLTDFCGGKNTQDSIVASQLLNSLKQVAHDTEICIIGICHTTKIQNVADINNQMEGSSKILAKARSALMLFNDETGLDPDRRVLVHTKSNYARTGRSIAVRLSNNSAEWIEYSKLTKDLLDEYSADRKSTNLPRFLAERYTELSETIPQEQQIANVLVNLARSDPEERFFMPYSYLKDHFGQIFGTQGNIKPVITRSMYLLPEDVQVVFQTDKSGNPQKSSSKKYGRKEQGKVIAEHGLFLVKVPKS